MSTAIFKITDGINQVDLLEVREGVCVEDWRQAVAQFKGAGGTFQESSLSDGRRLVDTKFAAMRESMPIKVGQSSGGSQNISIAILREMLALFMKASSYWVSDWQDEPVWLEKRADCETNTEYATVVTSNIPELADIFSSTFADGQMPNMILDIEHEHWQDVAPGQETATEISALEAYNGVNYGNVDSTGAREVQTDATNVFIANHRAEANITHIYHHNITTGAWSGNLAGAALPFAFTPALAIGQTGRTYFGIDSTLADSGPFRSLVFDVGIASVNLSGGNTWELYNSALAVWDLWDVKDLSPSNWGAIGIAHVWGRTTDQALANKWWQPANLLALLGGAAPNVTAWWVRVDLSNTGAGVVTPPQQQNRRIYAVTWPYTEVQSDQPGGDIPMLIRVQVHNRSGTQSTFPIIIEGAALADRMFIGARSLSRGSVFSSYINIADEQNIAGIIITTFAKSAFIEEIRAPAGRAIRYTSTGVGWNNAARIGFSSALIDEYRGRYRAFLRGITSDSTPTDSSVRLTISITTNALTPIRTIAWTGDAASFSDLGAGVGDTYTEMLDMGILTLPLPGPRMLDGEPGSLVSIQVQANADNTETVDLYDLILIPIDEWAGDFEDFTGRDEFELADTTLMLDPILVPAERLRTLLLENGLLQTPYLAITNGRPQLQPGGAQRLWFLFALTSGDGYRSGLEVGNNIQVSQVKRYLGPRGVS